MKWCPNFEPVFKVSAAGSSQTKKIFWASCDRDRVGRYITMYIDSDAAHHLAIHFGVPSYCLLDQQA